MFLGKKKNRKLKPALIKNYKKSEQPGKIMNSGQIAVLLQDKPQIVFLIQ